jgi:hypothetical protein
MSEPLFRHHLASSDLDWLPPPYRGIRTAVQGGIWTACGLGLVATVCLTHVVFVGFFKLAVLMGTAAYVAGDRTARAVLRARLAKLAHGAVDLHELPEEPDGELVHVAGRVQVLKSLRPLTEDRDDLRVAFRRVEYRAGRFRLVHEAAEDFWLVADAGEPVLVEVAGARLIAGPEPWYGYPTDGSVVRALEELPPPLGVDPGEPGCAISNERSIRAAETLVVDGDHIELVGYKARTIDPTVGMRLARDLPVRTTMRSGRLLPLLIAPRGVHRET